MRCISLTIFFEDPFWVGVFERQDNGILSVCKVTFGAKPKDEEVYQFILKKYHQLSFSPSVSVSTKQTQKRYKKRLRDIQRQVKGGGISTKSQQALKEQYETNKMAQRHATKQEQEAVKERKFLLKQAKRKNKHRGH